MPIFFTEETRKLDALRQRVIECQECEFYLTRTQPVFGEGRIDAAAMSVSEAPGAEEDATGLPFQGRAGKYWEGMLTTVGFKRIDLYVCNALCCRPPQNVIPDDYHNIFACNARLLAQIAIIQPKLIMVFGKAASFALGLLKKSDSLSSVVGNLRTRTGEPFKYVDFRGNGRTAELVVTYHPSYLMRGGLEQQKASWKAYNHLKEAKQLHDGLVISPNSK